MIINYLLSKSNAKTASKLINPQKDSSIDEIIEWIKHIGVDDIRNFTYLSPEPKRNGLICVVCNGTGKYKKWKWICLYGWPKDARKRQTALCRPSGESCFTNVDGIEYYMSFDEIIEIIKQMVENPKEIINIS